MKKLLKVTSVVTIVLLLIPAIAIAVTYDDEAITQYREELRNGGEIHLVQFDSFCTFVRDGDLKDVIDRAMAILQELHARKKAAAKGLISKEDAILILVGWADTNQVTASKSSRHANLTDEKFPYNSRVYERVGETVDNNNELSYLRVMRAYSIMRVVGIEDDDLRLIAAKPGGETDKFSKSDLAKNRTVTATFVTPKCQDFDDDQDGPCFREIPIPDEVMKPTDDGESIKVTNLAPGPGAENLTPDVPKGYTAQDSGWLYELYINGNTVVYEIKLDSSYTGKPGPLPEYHAVDRICWYGTPDCRMKLWYKDALSTEKRTDGYKAVFPMPPSKRLQIQHYFNVFSRDAKHKKVEIWYGIGSENLDVKPGLTVIEHWYYRSGRDMGACFAVVDLIQRHELDSLNCVRQKR
ncbi:hypothetical protein ACFL1U_00990 [Patescibacteria group bacterium]